MGAPFLSTPYYLLYIYIYIYIYNERKNVGTSQPCPKLSGVDSDLFREANVYCQLGGKEGYMKN